MTYGDNEKMSQRLSRMQRKGQITIPVEIREKWQLQEGDLIAFVETTNGVVISPQVTVPVNTSNKTTKILDRKEIKAGARDKGADTTLTDTLSIAPNGPDIISFLQGLQFNTTPVQKPSQTSVVQKTFGVFQSDKKSPADFKSHRAGFIEHLGTESN